ncbi:MFS transporter [Alkalihalobacterium chitinilyticum]|uniref:MFS transporter n=1 Tax=Alkalihalobacterium chitinilyticum TaxID=2980103 RepID=A0ABT5VKE6_9BACI|nr:MFS transporter [Alkalihalobacterium chitinilyticum]MDE5415916.1 MFS transporter [Alkalihalobacterium chitinilyticum]
MTQFEKSFYSKTSMYAFIVVLLLIISMWIGTKQFSHVDMMLFGYLISSFVFAIGMTVRICAWSMRPATHQVLKRTIQNLKARKRQKRNFKSVMQTLVDNILFQKFIFKRGIYRGIQHWLVAWGCIGSFAITFGLTFGWMHFKLVDATTYQLVVMGYPMIKMAADGLFAELVFNGLNITALMVLGGVVMMMIRRQRDKGVQVTQRFEFDLFPLYMLLAVTVSGLLLTVSYKFLDGFIHSYLALFHQFTVVIFLVYFPFGKLFHLPIRPLAVAVPMNYQEQLKVDTRPCKKCGTTYSSDDQIDDVKDILGAQAFDLQLKDGSYLADYCPSCRRRMRVMSQLNLENAAGNPFGPIQTNNGIHIPGFGHKRSEDFYDETREGEK